MNNRIASLLLLFGMVGCLDPYSPPIKTSDVNILVVDGLLDTSEGTANVTLGRGVSLGLPDSFPRVQNAFVAIEDSRGNVYPLTEGDSGRYRASNIPVLADAQYRLNVLTQENDLYHSEFVTPLDTPPIDSVTWITDDDVLTIRVNAHDPTKVIKHFRWSFDETWNYHAATISQYKVVGHSIVAREPQELTFYCWRTQSSSSILIGSTDRLRESIISQTPIQHIRAGSQKFQILYSILVRQMAISPEEYAYLDQLKKTTESIGGLFDPQPGQVTGNVTRVNANSPVAVGYFGASHSVSSRIFIPSTKLPRQFLEIWPLAGCLQPDTVCVTPRAYLCVVDAKDLTEGYTLGLELDDGAGYTLTTAPCSDCRLAGGVLKKPDFWP
jgi:hypothetical protein